MEGEWTLLWLQHWICHTEPIDEQVIPVILPEHLYLTRTLPDGRAVQE